MKQGVIVIAHGSRQKEWNSLVREMVEQIDMKCPVEVAFLGMVEGSSIVDGIQKLERQGVQRIVAVPLFISSGSTHLAEIRYALGVGPYPSIPTDLERIPLRTSTEIVWAEPMDDHACIRALLRERVAHLSVCPAEEALLLVAHGSEEDGYQEKWEKLLQDLSSDLCRELGLRTASYSTFHPDTIREQAHLLAKDYRLIVIPLFLSSGYYTKTAIPHRLEGIPVRYDGRAYLPDPNVAKWLKMTAEVHLA